MVSRASFQGDVFAVTYARQHDPSSAVLSGGIDSTIFILQSDRTKFLSVAAFATVQGMRLIPGRGHVMYGGGNGLVAVLDPSTGAIVDSANRHTKKVPAVACAECTAATGSFDNTVRLWDCRTQLRPTVSLDVHEVVTAVALEDNLVAACCGNSLLLWDQRNMAQVYCSKNGAWSGLTRGLQLFATEKIVVSASVDGVARFWTF